MTGRHGSPIERFERSYIPEPNSGCWIWLGSLKRTGYGHFYFPPRNMVTCDNPACVNPDHLSLGTHQQNMKEREERERRAPPKGSLNGRARITEEDVVLIRSSPLPLHVLARQWDMPISTMKKIKRRYTWKHVP